MARLRSVRASLPPGDPRDWLSAAVLEHGGRPTPVVIVAGGAAGRRVVHTDDPPPSVVGALEARLLEDDEVGWVGAWGTTVLERGRLPTLVSFCRIRDRSGNCWVRTWPRRPGATPDPSMVEEWSGSESALPGWVGPLFPGLRLDPDITIDEDGDGDEPPLPDPDACQFLPPDVALREVVWLSAQWLEGRAVGGASLGVVAWLVDGPLVTWAMTGDVDVPRFVREVAQNPGVRAVGTWRSTEGTLDLSLEDREGAALRWSRRPTSAPTLQSARPSGWFDQRV